MTTEAKDPVTVAVNAPPLVKDRGYALDPEGKAALMTPAAGPLIRILSGPTLATLVAGYEMDNQTAITAQKHYRHLHWCAIIARYGIIILGILALTFAQSLKSWLHDDIKPWLGAALILQLVLFLAALSIGLYMRATHPLERWMRLRAFAEVKRLAFFDSVMRRQEPAKAGEIAFLQLKLEFIVRYLLEPQLAYFKGRAKELGRGTGLGTASLVILGLVIVYTVGQLALSLAVQLAVYVPPFPFDPELAMGRALIGAAFAVLLATTTLSQIDERNALRFSQTAENLQALRDRTLGAVKLAAARGEDAVVVSFVRILTEQVGFGAADWLSLAELDAIAVATPPAPLDPDLVSARRFLAALSP